MDSIESRIAYYLVEKGLIRKEDLESVFPPDQPAADISVEDQLINAGLLSLDEFRSAAEEFFGTSFASQEDFPKEPLLFDHLSAQFMKESKFIPSRLTDNTVTVIMSNPLDFYTIDAIRLATNYEVHVLAGREKDISEAIERSYGVGATSMEKIIEDTEAVPEYREDDEENVDHLRDMASYYLL